MSGQVSSMITKDLICSLIVKSRRVGGKAVLMVLLLSAAASINRATAHASIVTMTLTGTVTQGSDNGVFGPVSSSLVGESFKLIYTFDDSKGMSGDPSCSSISNTATSSPGTAVLQIGTGSWSFGNVGNESSSSHGDFCNGSFHYLINDQYQTSLPVPTGD
jgi:hypothetical protein